MKIPELKKPQMILFDYGQTLIDQHDINGLRGTKAVLQYAVRNKYHRTAEEVQAVADEINEQLCRRGLANRKQMEMLNSIYTDSACGELESEKRQLLLSEVEIPTHMFTSYLYESQGIELSLSVEEVDRVFWDAAAPGRATEGIGDFLRFLEGQNIRTGVISNLSYCGRVLEERINRLVPENRFEFIIATSEYLFRKPNKRIFDLALEKAGLSAEEVWYIGDDYGCDIIGARNAGLQPIWYLGAIDVPYTRREDVFTVGSWEELRHTCFQIA